MADTGMDLPKPPIAKVETTPSQVKEGVRNEQDLASLRAKARGLLGECTQDGRLRLYLKELRENNNLSPSESIGLPVKDEAGQEKRMNLFTLHNSPKGEIYHDVLKNQIIDNRETPYPGLPQGELVGISMAVLGEEPGNYLLAVSNEEGDVRFSQQSNNKPEVLKLIIQGVENTQKSLENWERAPSPVEAEQLTKAREKLADVA